ncbi:MAG TPA: hypothetical protein VIV60_00850 [Polyangiaceae bacterium]
MRSFPIGAFTLTAALTLLTGLGFYVLRHQGSEQQLFGLEARERSTLYARTIETLRSTCANAKELELIEYCREQAHFVLRFPECDNECQSLCRTYLPRPTK